MTSKLINVKFSAAAMLSLTAVAMFCVEPAQAERTEKQNRSAFEYQDGQAPEKRPYLQPNFDIDPTDLSIEEMRARLNYLEERIERVEQAIERSERAKR